MKKWYMKHSAAIEHWAIKTVNVLFLVTTLYVLSMTCYAMQNSSGIMVVIGLQVLILIGQAYSIFRREVDQDD